MAALDSLGGCRQFGKDGKGSSGQKIILQIHDAQHRSHEGESVTWPKLPMPLSGEQCFRAFPPSGQGGLKFGDWVELVCASFVFSYEDAPVRV